MSPSSAQRRITDLATATAVHRAFHWLHLHQPQLRNWQLEMVRIPAPPFGESTRAAWFLDRFHQLGLTNIHLDDAGDVLAELGPESSSTETPCVLLSAHLDTVFPPGTLTDPTEEKNSPRIHAPGICDNAAGLTGLLAIAAALRYAKITPPIPILFAANVGEEGEGDLRGMRHLFERGPYRTRIAAAIALEGSGSSAVVTRALGSLRFRVTITGPGGHSWTDAGTLNPILLLSQAITRIAAINLPANPLTTVNVGHISGGTSINSIPESATALLDIRSTRIHPTHRHRRHHPRDLQRSHHPGPRIKNCNPIPKTSHRNDRQPTRRRTTRRLGHPTNPARRRPSPFPPYRTPSGIHRRQPSSVTRHPRNRHRSRRPGRRHSHPPGVVRSHWPRNRPAPHPPTPSRHPANQPSKLPSLVVILREAEDLLL